MILQIMQVKKGADSNAGGASGSIYIKGKGIQTLVFDVYIKGDGGSDGWSDTGADTFFWYVQHGC